MPTPIGHALAGLVLGSLRERHARPSAIVLTGSIVAALAPDSDIILGMLSGDRFQFHRTFTHSLPFGLLASLVLTYAIVRIWRHPWWSTFATLSVAYLSHLFLDLFTRGTHPPFGVPLLAPFSDRRFSAGQFVIGPDVIARVELIVLLPVVGLVLLLMTRSRRVPPTVPVPVPPESTGGAPGV